jgi:hypothetical protein
MAEGDDRELEEYLRGDSRLSAAYGEVRHAEPPADLDEIVLEKARREVHLGPKVAWSPFIRAWSVPLALAAVLVLSVTVTLVMQEQTGEPLPVPPKPAADGPAAAPSPAREQAAPPAPFRAERGATADRSLPAPDTLRGREAAASAGRERPAGPGAAAPPVQPETKAAESLRAKEEVSAESGLGPDPEVWVRRIEALRREGRAAEADALLAEFRKRFPGYPEERLPR